MTPEECLAVLREILTDIVNQLEVTPRGYYIYRFDLKTMHRIADAIGIAPSDGIVVGPVLAAYQIDELGNLIRPE